MIILRRGTKLLMIGLMAWLMDMLTPAFASAQDDVECAAIMYGLSHVLVGDQKAGARRIYSKLDKKARKSWFREYPFNNYDSYALGRIVAYSLLDGDVLGGFYVANCEEEDKPW